MEFSKRNWSTISETICPYMLIFWQVGLLDIALSEYPDKSHNFRNFIFMTSHNATEIIHWWPFSETFDAGVMFYRGPFLDSLGNFSGPETRFVFAVFAFTIKVSIILKMIQ